MPRYVVQFRDKAGYTSALGTNTRVIVTAKSKEAAVSKVRKFKQVASIVKIEEM